MDPKAPKLLGQVRNRFLGVALSHHQAQEIRPDYQGEQGFPPDEFCESDGEHPAG
jgi:hypothetical protein